MGATVAVLDIKGVRIGEGRPKTVVSLMDGRVEGLLETARHAMRQGADCLEWRVDFFEDVGDAEAVTHALAALVDATPTTPLIVTLRTKAQGGCLDLTRDDSATLVQHLITRGKPDLIDIEYGLGEELVASLVDRAHARGIAAIVSHHDFSGTPTTEAMRSLLERMAALGADIPKLAVMAREEADAARLMQATRLVSKELDVPLLTLAMGSVGAHTRLEGELFGSALTFCALGRASAPGQVELAETIVALESLHAAICERDGMPHSSCENPICGLQDGG